LIGTTVKDEQFLYSLAYVIVRHIKKHSFCLILGLIFASHVLLFIVIHLLLVTKFCIIIIIIIIESVKY